MDCTHPKPLIWIDKESGTLKCPDCGTVFHSQDAPTETQKETTREMLYCTHFCPKCKRGLSDVGHAGSEFPTRACPICGGMTENRIVSRVFIQNA